MGRHSDFPRWRFRILLPAAKSSGGWLGFSLAAITILANAVAAVLGCSVNREGLISPFVVTVISMGAGAIVLLGIGIIIQGFPPIGPSAWAVIIWLAVVNTALAYF